MASVWKTTLRRHVKISLFSAPVQSILLHSCESLDGCYTRLLRTGLNISQDEHMTYELITLPSVVEKIVVRRMRLAGHCHQHSEPPAKTAGTHPLLLTYERKILVQNAPKSCPDVWRTEMTGDWVGWWLGGLSEVDIEVDNGPKNRWLHLPVGDGMDSREILTFDLPKLKPSTQLLVELLLPIYTYSICVYV